MEADRPLALDYSAHRPSLATLDEAERLAAEAWKVDLARFSVNGSSAANQASVMSLASPGDKVIVSRTLHKSVLLGLVYAGVNPVWINPRFDELGFPLDVSPADLFDVLTQHPDAVGVFIGSPTYVGSFGDIAELARICHRVDTPLVVDAAWGGHFGFHPLLPPSASSEGADIVVFSAHKTLPAWTQGAVLLAQGPRVNMSRINKVFDGTQTTSPSAAILASVDASRAMLERDGEERLSRIIPAVQKAKDILSEAGLPTLDGPHMDPLKLVILTGRAGIDGRELARHPRLFLKGIEFETIDKFLIIPQITIADSPDDILYLANTIALIAISNGTTRSARVERVPPVWHTRPVVKATPREAFFAASETVTADAAVGRISSEIIAPYPPGVPALSPGELITADGIERLHLARESGIHIAYAADPTLETFRVMF